MVIGSNWIHLRSSRDARRRFIGAYFVAIRDTSLIFYEFFLNEMCFFTIMIIWFLFVEMFKYTLKCGSLQNKIWYYSALVPKYLPSEASIPGPSLVIVVAIRCRSSVSVYGWWLEVLNFDINLHYVPTSAFSLFKASTVSISKLKTLLSSVMIYINLVPGWQRAARRAQDSTQAAAAIYLHLISDSEAVLSSSSVLRDTSE